MSSMKLHFLDARGALADLGGWLEAVLSNTYEKANALMALRPLDVVVRAGARVVPQKGHLGYAPEPGVVFVTVDPGNPVLRANAEASLERMFAHELHHAARWDGPGYGSSLGEALVSEGLAGNFAQEIFGGPPEPWESLSLNQIRAHIAHGAREWNRRDYDHEAWFFGTADLPDGLGYSLGFRLIERFLSEHADYKASTLAGTDAQEFRSCLDAI